MSPRFARRFYLLYESIDGPRTALALRESEHPLADDVALHFGGAAVDDLGFAALPDDGGAVGAPPLLELGVGLDDQRQPDPGSGRFDRGSVLSPAGCRPLVVAVA